MTVFRVAVAVSALLGALHQPALAQDKTKAPAAEINACTLLTDDEVTRTIGLKVEAGVRRDSGVTASGAYSSTCLWKVAADKDAKDPSRPLGGARFAILNAIVWTKDGPGPASFLQSFRDAAKHHVIESTPVALKIGEESLWWGDGVAVRKGDKSFGMSVRLSERDKERSFAEALAAKVLTRLP